MTGLRGGGRFLGRFVLPLALVVVTIAVLGLGVFPTSTFLAKREEASRAEARLTALRAANADAERRAAELRTDAEIERLARAELGLARPGEETYVVLPAPQDPIEVPEGWPFEHVGPTLADSPAG